MSTKEVDTLIQTKDAEGNHNIHYPITLGANVLISDELAAQLALAADADPTVNAALSALLAALNNSTSGGVTSFNGRTGAVEPKAGDYTADDVGAVPTTRKVNNKALSEDITLDKSDVGLGNVPNVATNDQTPTYTEATTLATLTSGERLSVVFGKIKKAITDLISHLANKSNPHGVTAAQIGAAASSHNQAASTITSGTFAAARIPTLAASKIGAGTFAATGVVAAAGTDYTTQRVRNIGLVTAATNPSTNGAITFIYE